MEVNVTERIFGNSCKKVVLLLSLLSFLLGASIPVHAKAPYYSCAELTENADCLVSANNGLFFMERNPGYIVPAPSFIGIHKREDTGFLYAFKSGESVRFDAEKTGKLYRDQNGKLKTDDETLEKAVEDFSYAALNGIRYEETFYRTEKLANVNAFEDLLAERTNNGVMAATEANALNVVYDKNTKQYELKMQSEEKMEKFLKEYQATKDAVGECDALVYGITDKKEIIRKVNAFICDRLSYSAESVTKQNGRTEPYDEIEALTYGVGTICAGYSNLFKLLCEHYGIETENVSDRSINHGWNKSKIDGVWYYTDATWNDENKNRETYLLLDEQTMTARHNAALGK